MQISGNAFSSAVSGIQSGQKRLDQAARQIAETSAVPREDDSAVAADPVADLGAAMVEQRFAQYQTQAGVKVAQSADEALGTLIDIRA
jgi:flagellar hook protein FlgE